MTNPDAFNPISLPPQRGHIERSGFGMELQSQPSLVFGALHGAFGSEQQWDRAKAYYNRYGHELIAVRLPIDDPNASYADQADFAAEVLAPYEEEGVRLLASSRGCNVGAALLDRMELASITYICGSIPPTKADIAAGKLELLPEKHGELFDSGIKPVVGKPGLTYIESQIAKDTIFYRCEEEIAIEGIALLREQREREDDVVLLERPSIPEHAMVGAFDPVVSPEYVRRASLAFLGRPAVSIAAGHLPFLSNPVLFGGITIAQALHDMRLSI